MRKPSIPRTHWLVIFVAMASLFGLACSNDLDTPFESVAEDSGSVVAGRVAAGASDGAAGAVVHLAELTDQAPLAVMESLISPSSAFAVSSAKLRIAVTDKQGRFSFRNVPPGTYSIRAALESHLAGTARVDVSSASAAETSFVNIDLVPTGKLYGVVTLENETVHRNTFVYIQGTSYVAVTDDTGSYSLTGVPVGSHTAVATHNGYLDDSEQGSLVAAGDSTELAPMLLRKNSNIPPTASPDQIAAFPGQTIFAPVSFSGTGTDVDGNVVLYEWDFEDDGVFDYANAGSATTSHLYVTEGTYTAKLRVTDDDGAVGLAAIQLTIYQGFYVRTDGDDGGPGTANAPFETISHAITQAAAIGIPVLVGQGTYTENITLASHVPVWGGYDAGWNVVGQSNVQTVGGGPVDANAVVSTGLTNILVLGSPGSEGGASVALRVVNCGSSVAFTSCRFRASSGLNATVAGANGVFGIPGAPGSPGSDALEIAGGPGGAGGGLGGRGGNGGCDSEVPGEDGVDGNGLFPASGGTGGQVFQNGSNGGGGIDGANGNHGGGADVWGSVIGLNWVANTGGDGYHGFTGFAGAGGGGGGGGQVGNCDGFPTFNDVYGGGGGGGGGGGDGAEQGRGGNGGGASIAVLLIDSSPTFEICVFQTGNGGDGSGGGNGGLGGIGGFGGIGGAGETGAGNGGAGGKGGEGGNGGGGQGGPGGPCLGIYRWGSSTPTNISPTYMLASPGLGGPGGYRGNNPGDLAPSGPNGLAISVYP